MSIPSTSMGMLSGMLDPDRRDDYWGRFFSIYGPIMRSWCLGRGVPTSAVDDLTQDIMAKLFRALSQYDPAKGKFRAWLGQVIRTGIADYFRRLEKTPAADAVGGSTFHELIENVQSPEALGDLASSLEVHVDSDQDLALSRVRARVDDKTWQIFKTSVEEECTATDIAKRFGVTKAAVHQARYRIGKWVREEYDRIASAKKN